MTKAVVVEEEASDELREGAAWYEQDRAGLGVELLNAVDAVFDTLATSTAAAILVPGFPVDSRIRRVLSSVSPMRSSSSRPRTPCTSSPSLISPQAELLARSRSRRLWLDPSVRSLTGRGVAGDAIRASSLFPRCLHDRGRLQETRGDYRGLVAGEEAPGSRTVATNDECRRPFGTSSTGQGELRRIEIDGTFETRLLVPPSALLVPRLELPRDDLRRIERLFERRHQRAAW